MAEVKSKDICSKKQSASDSDMIRTLGRTLVYQGGRCERTLVALCSLLSSGISSCYHWSQPCKHNDYVRGRSNRRRPFLHAKVYPVTFADTYVPDIFDGLAMLE